MQTVLRVEGMSCAACVRHVKNAVSKLPSVTRADVEIGRLEVEFDPEKLSVADIASAVAEAGYTARV